MKKLIFTTMVVAGFIGNTYSQDNENRRSLLVGVKAGVNYSNVYDTEGEEFKADPKIGLAAGVFLHIPVGKYLGVQPEVLFSQKGFTATGRFLGNRYEFSRTTNYIDVPLLLAIKPAEFLSIVAGPQYSYLLSRNDDFESTGFSGAQEQEFNNDNIRKNTLCFTGGADINLRHFVLGLRAGWDIMENNGDGSTTTPRYKNAWYQVTVGFRLYND